MTSSSKPCFQYINGIFFSYYHIHKILNVLQSDDYTGLSKVEELQTYNAAFVILESAY